MSTSADDALYAPIWTAPPASVVNRIDVSRLPIYIHYVDETISADDLVSVITSWQVILHPGVHYAIPTGWLLQQTPADQISARAALFDEVTDLIDRSLNHPDGPKSPSAPLLQGSIQSIQGHLPKPLRYKLYDVGVNPISDGSTASPGLCLWHSLFINKWGIAETMVAHQSFGGPLVISPELLALTV